jgi:hypothetical protein
MTWSIYTQLTSHSRGVESIVAMFCLFWAAWVSALIGQGGTPMQWAGMTGSAQYTIPALLALSGALHVVGLRLLRVMPLSAILRAVGMLGMSGVFGWLCWTGLRSTAGPTYLAFTAACLGGVLNAVRDARYARGLPNG